jgi:hypothetical protein
MSIVFDASELSEATASGESVADAFDPSVHFERWLQDLQAGQKPLAPEYPKTHEEEDSEIPACVSSLDTERLFVYDVSSPLGG